MNLARRAAASGLVIVCIVGLGVAFQGQILPGLGHLLTNYEQPQNADMIVVLGGDWRGFRILKGAELAREGFASKVLSSGGGSWLGELGGGRSREEVGVLHGATSLPWVRRPRESNVTLLPPPVPRGWARASLALSEHLWC